MQSQYEPEQNILMVSATVDKIEQQCHWIIESLHKTEWTIISPQLGSNCGYTLPIDTYTESLKEIQFHLEGIVNYMDQLTEDIGLEVTH